ncbi:hypothetical protein JST97_22015 [bacterium]|nr:hypothetical protein [bacterium]
MTLSLENFLEDLKAEARHDSSGQFTLDLSHARDKLATFQLKRTDDLILKLVQCGVAGGASKLSFESTSTQVRFTFHDLVFRESELGVILNYLLHPDPYQNRALTHLATAVNTAVGTRPSAIALACWDGKRGYLVRWSSQGKQILPWSSDRGYGPQTQFQLTRTPSEWKETVKHLFNQRDVLGMLFGWKSGWSAEEELLADRAAWCPVPITMNGKTLPEVPLVMGRERSSQRELQVKHRFEMRLSGGSGSRGLRLAQRKLGAWPESEFPEGPVAVVMTAGPEERGKMIPSYVELVSDGIITERRRIAGVPREHFVRVLASADAGFKTALDGFLLVDDESYQELIRWLMEQAAALFPSGGLGPLPQLSLDRRR